MEDMCYERLRAEAGVGLVRVCPSRTSERGGVYLLLQYLLQSCSRGGGGGSGGHVLRETTSRGLCELVCPSRTSERGGTSERVSVCVCYCRTYYKAVCGGGGGQ